VGSMTEPTDPIAAAWEVIVFGEGVRSEVLVYIDGYEAARVAKAIRDSTGRPVFPRPTTISNSDELANLLNLRNAIEAELREGLAGIEPRVGALELEVRVLKRSDKRRELIEAEDDREGGPTSRS